MAIESNFALLDVKEGREELTKRFGVDPFSSTGSVRIPVRIEGFIIYQWNNGDDESTEFAVDVTKVEEL